MTTSNEAILSADPATASIELRDEGIRVDCSPLVMLARAVAPGVTRLAVGRPSANLDEPSRVVLPQPACESTVEWLEDAGIELRLEAQILRFNAMPPSFELCSAEGEVLVAASARASVQPATEGGVELCLSLPAGMLCLGLGEKHGGLNKRGRRWLMANAEPIGVGRDKDPLYQSHPFMLGLFEGRAFGIYLDCAAHSWFDLDHGEPGHALIGTPREVAAFYLVSGPDPREVIERYTGLIGRTPLPPRWALGHHQSRWSYADEGKVRAIAAGLDQHEIPTDAIHLDIDYMDGYRVFTWNRKRFPDPKGLVDDLERRGFKTVTILDPGVKVDERYSVYQEGKEEGHFLRRADGTEYRGSVWPGTTAFPDFTREETRRWWADKVAELLRTGVAGIWNDMNEPAWWIPLPNRNLFRKSKMRPHDVLFEDGGKSTPFFELNNLYGRNEAAATVEAFERHRPERRPFVLTRSGFSGIQRFAAMWTGDIASRWEDMAGSIQMLAGLGLSGYPFCGADIGGFSHSCTPELYGRWIQLGSVYPFCRTHCMKGMRAQEPWSFGERITGVAREALELRYRLMPYLVGVFRRAEERGLPVMAPLLLEFSDDERAVACEDQVMLGSELMAAPVLLPGGTEREVVLPRGAWFDFRRGDRYEGGSPVTVAAPLEAGLPLFARAGALIPLWPARKRAADPLPERVGLRGFPARERVGRLDWFDEPGDGFDYREGSYCEIPYELRVEDSSVADGRAATGGGALVSLVRLEQRGELPPAHERIEVELFLSTEPESVESIGAELSAEWTFEEGRLRCELVEPKAPWKLLVRLPIDPKEA